MCIKIICNNLKYIQIWSNFVQFGSLTVKQNRKIISYVFWHFLCIWILNQCPQILQQPIYHFAVQPFVGKDILKQKEMCTDFCLFDCLAIFSVNFVIYIVKTYSKAKIIAIIKKSVLTFTWTVRFLTFKNKNILPSSSEGDTKVKLNCNISICVIFLFNSKIRILFVC